MRSNSSNSKKLALIWRYVFLRRAGAEYYRLLVMLTDYHVFAVHVGFVLLYRQPPLVKRELSKPTPTITATRCASQVFEAGR